jgi:hypothetical protein
MNIDWTLKFWARVDKNGPIHPIYGQCWLWIGSGEGRYGRMYRKGKSPLSHVMSWEIHFGEVSKGLCVCHKCDNPLCVNPDHLFTGTQSDNLKDMTAKGRRACGSAIANFGEKNGNCKLTQESVNRIKGRLKLKHTLKAIAADEGVHFSLISLIKNNKIWKEKQDV